MPSASTHADSYIPIVDLSSSTAPVELLDAAANNGFIFIKHTGDIGLAPEDVDEVFDIVRSFPVYIVQPPKDHLHAYLCLGVSKL